MRSTPSTRTGKPVGFVPTRITMALGSIVKSLSLTSHAPSPSESDAQTRTRAVVVTTAGRVHAYVFLPCPKEPENMGYGNVRPPSVDRSAVTARTPSSRSVILQSTRCVLPPPHTSPPFGASTVTVGARFTGGGVLGSSRYPLYWGTVLSHAYPTICPRLLMSVASRRRSISDWSISRSRSCSPPASVNRNAGGMQDLER